MQFRTIEPDLIAQERAGRVGFEIAPVENINEAKVRWNQEDNYFGLQHLRGLDGAPTRVQRAGSTTYEYEPGVFGEFYDITEQELTIRSQNLDVDISAIDVDDLVQKLDRRLIGREDDRIESSIWTLATTGAISITLDSPDGTQTGYKDSYPTQTYTAGTSWLNFSTATPIQNFQSIQQLGFASGHSVDFGARAKLYMNQVTANRMLNNGNQSDFAGRRNMYGATLNALPGFNSYLQAQNLPEIVIYDKGYEPNKGTQASGIGGYTAATFKKYIADGVGVVIGERPSKARIMSYMMTRNAQNGYKSGSYRRIFDRTANGPGGRIPGNIEVHRGHNGGPVIWYPSAMIVVNF